MNPNVFSSLTKATILREEVNPIAVLRRTDLKSNRRNFFSVTSFLQKFPPSLLEPLLKSPIGFPSLDFAFAHGGKGILKTPLRRRLYDAEVFGGGCCCNR